MTKVYKTINGHAPSIMDILLIFSKNTHNLKFFQIILKKTKKKVTYGSLTISYRTLLLWANRPEEYKLADSLSECKSKIRSWRCDTCICRLC